MGNPGEVKENVALIIASADKSGRKSNGVGPAR